MKKIIIIFIVVCLLLVGCSDGALNSTGKIKGTGQSSSESSNNVEEQNSQSASSSQVTPTIPAGETSSVIQPSSSDASVEVLVAIGEKLLDALFADNEEEALIYCKGALKDAIEEKPEKYINDKPDYTIEGIETTIKPLKDGKYLLMATVSATSKKSPTQKLSFKYELTALKEKADYHIIEYKRPTK